MLLWGLYFKVKLVPAEGLDSTRKALETVTSVHVYSVQAASPSQPADASTQVRRTNAAYDHDCCTNDRKPRTAHELAHLSCTRYSSSLQNVCR